MKKISILILVFTMSITLSYAQKGNMKMNPKYKNVKQMQQNAFTGSEVLPDRGFKAQKEIPFGVEIGTTKYDLQSNGSVAQRLLNNNGNLSATWTMGFTPTAFADRGTGYVYYNGSSWGSAPTTRIENIRTGWPNPGILSSGKEFVVSHGNPAGVTTGLNFTNRPSAGSGAWVNGRISAAKQTTWPRVAVSGNNIHCIAADGAGTAGAPGGYGDIYYYRSTNGGETWDKSDVNLDPEGVATIAIGGDSYDIDAKGNTIAIALFGQFEDISLLKSTNNGETWTKTIVNDFPLDGYFHGDPVIDMDQDGVADTILTSDNMGSVVIDNNGMAHVFFGRMQVLDDDPEGEGSSWFPTTDGLFYWNETMGEKVFNAADMVSTPSVIQLCYTSNAVLIAAVEDLNNNQEYDFVDVALQEFPFGNYYSSMCSMPSAGVDAGGTIYLSYSAVMEGEYYNTDAEPNPQHFRHIYVMKSTNNGYTWGNPVNISIDDDALYEYVFASMARNVDGNVHLIYQVDEDPGLNVRGDDDPVTVNSIIYKAVPTGDLPTSAAPWFTSTPITTAATNSLYTYTATGTDPQGDAFTFAAELELPSWLTLNGATLSGTPAEAGAYEIELSITAGTDVSYQHFHIYVTSGNQAPSFSSTPITTGVTGTLYTYTATATDPEGDALTFAAPTLPLWLTFVSGVLSGAPTEVGTYAVALTVTDGTSTATQNFSIVVAAGNQAPVITSTEVTGAVVGLLYSYTVVAIDENVSALTYVATTAPAWLTFAGNVLSGTPTAEGTENVVITVSDGTLSATQSFAIVVSPANSVFNVTFEVDLNCATNFVFGTDTVYIAGEVDSTNWQQPGTNSNLTLTDDNNDKIYSVTLSLEAGTYQYKYFKNYGFGNGEWNGTTNRSVSVAANVTVSDIWGEIDNFPFFNVSFIVKAMSDNSVIVDAQVILGLDTATTDATGKVSFCSHSGENIAFSVKKADYIDYADSITVTADMETEVMIEKTGVNNINTQNITVNPNPAKNNICINNVENATIVIYNTLGKEVARINKADNNCTFDVSKLNEGTYFVKITSNNTVVTKKINVIR